MTLLFTDPIYLKHETGRHVEMPNRLRAVTTRLETAHLIEKCTPGVSRPLNKDEVAAIHDLSMIGAVEEVAEKGGGRLDPDTVVSKDSFAVALVAAGACSAAVDSVVQGEAPNALCLVRPPGHHATPTRSMGFCLFNNIALAAHRARTAHGLDRILIVDWDVHHGNGTQDVFYEDPQVTFVSVHRYGGGFYPGTGAADETGTGKGLGHTVNVPLRFGISRKDYYGAFTRALEKAADRVRPQLVLVSAGFDAHARDPIGSLGLEVEDFTALTREVLAVAKTHADGRLVSCLEGGYNLNVLAEAVQTHLEELLRPA
jgi:acetoin utilization deacetylase AcuC-like enzyme